MFEKVFAVMLNTQKSPLAPMLTHCCASNRGDQAQRPLFEGGFRGIVAVATCKKTLKHPLRRVENSG